MTATTVASSVAHAPKAADVCKPRRPRRLAAGASGAQRQGRGNPVQVALLAILEDLFVSGLDREHRRGLLEANVGKLAAVAGVAFAAA
jgi:hypothetical protein